MPAARKSTVERLDKASSYASSKVRIFIFNAFECADLGLEQTKEPEPPRWAARANA